MIPLHFLAHAFVMHTYMRMLTYMQLVKLQQQQAKAIAHVAPEAHWTAGQDGGGDRTDSAQQWLERCGVLHYRVLCCAAL